MKFKEFLKSFLKSLRKGRLHRVLKATFLVLFLFLSYKVSVGVVSYWLKEKEKFSVVNRNLHVGFDWRRGELSLRADYLAVETPRCSCEFFRPEVDFSLYRSLRELRPVISFVGFSTGRVYVAERKEKEKKRTFPSFPFLVERLDVGRFTFVWGKNQVIVNRFVYGKRAFFCGGLTGVVNGRRVFVEPFMGYKVDGNFLVPDFSLLYDGWTVSGKLKVSSLRDWEFLGYVDSSVFSGSFNVKNYGKLRVDWKGRVEKIETEGSGVLRVEEGGILVERVRGRLNGGFFSLRGKVGEKVKLSGEFVSKDFNYRDFLAKGVKAEFFVTGTLKDPRVVFDVSVDRLGTPLVELHLIKVRGWSSKSRGKFVWRSRKVDGTAFFLWKERKGKGSIRLKNFQLNDIPVVRKYRRKYSEWIPELSLTGDLRFEAAGKRILYSGSLKVSRLIFQGFEALGNLEVKGDSEKVSLTGNLEGRKGGSVKGEAEISIKERRINSFLVLDSVPTEQFRFLKRIGLSGAVSGSGRVRGKLSNPEARFTVSSNSLCFKGVNLGKVSGNVVLVDRVLSVSAITGKGVLDLLKISLKGKRELLVKGSVNNVSGRDVERVLKGFGVKLPLGIEGVGNGRFFVYSEDLRKKEYLQVNVKVDKFFGKFTYRDLEVQGSAEGSVNYKRGKVFVDLRGKIEKASYKGKILSGGNYRLSLKDKKLFVSLNGVRYSSGAEGLENEISGKVLVDLENKEVKGNGRVEVNYSHGEEFRISADVVYSVSGVLDEFTVKISGKLHVKSKAMGEEELKIEGTLLEPQNFGTITVYNGNTDLKLIANGNYWQAVGVVRNLQIQSEKVKVVVNMAFVNVNVTDLTGTIAVPTFKVYPKGFYPLYSVSGLYVTLKEGKPELSDITVSYVDGWIKIKDLSVDEKKKRLSGKVDAEVGAKGLAYAVKAQSFLPYVRGSFKVKGSFSYEGEIRYRIDINGTGVEFKSRYLLNKAVVNHLKAVVENNRLEEVRGNISVGSGSAVIEGREDKLEVTTSLIPVGEVDKWKGLISGKVTYGKDGIKGTLTVSKARVFMKGKNREKETKETGQPELPINVNVNLLFDQPLEIKGELFKLTLVPKLWIKTVNRRVVVGGTFYITEGKIDYMGKKFKVIYGTGTITDLYKKKGRISILASTYISGYYIYMKIEGSFNDLTIYLSSDPPLTREQILNLIMTGASPEEIEASSELFPAIQVAYYATASLLKPFEMKFQKTLKLESFSIEPYITKYGETVVKLTVAKKLAERIRLVGYGTTGQNPEYGGSIQIFLNKNYYLELRYNSYYGPEAGIGLEVNRK